MKYNLKINEQSMTIDAQRGEDEGALIMTEGDSSATILCRPVSANQTRVNFDDKGVSLFTAQSEEGLWVWIEGKARLVIDGDKAQPRKGGGPSLEGPDTVTPPTPATVMRIPVQVGQMVEKGQACAVVSAMKMEITLPAPYSGKVIAINSEAGAQVSPGDIIVEIERSAQDDQQDPEKEGPE
jgi:biotin carboxyl carrier protein